VPVERTGRVAVAEVGVAATESVVPPSVTVGRFEPVHEETPVTAQRAEPLIPIEIGVPDALEVTNTDVIDGAASEEAEIIEHTAAINKPFRWFLSISIPCFFSVVPLRGANS
jgi:hypothetical protein